MRRHLAIVTALGGLKADQHTDLRVECEAARVRDRVGAHVEINRQRLSAAQPKFEA